MKEYSLEHRIRKPEKQTAGKPPLILLLHGYGSDENDLFSFAPELPPEYFIVSAKAPIPMQPFGNAWYHINIDASGVKSSDDAGAIEARDTISKFIKEIVAGYDLDAQRVTLLGFSQGTILSYAVALTFPERVKNVIALSGYINEEIIELQSNPAYNHLEIYCSHGTVDQVIPVTAARKAPDFLKNLGIETELHEFPVGHGVAPQNFYELKAWLEGNS